MVTLEQTQKAMLELVNQAGIPNGKLAFWSACLSSRNRLENNARQTLVMRQYVDKPLPEKSVLRAQLGAILTRTLDALYAIESLWNTGQIDFNCGFTYESQAAWRERMASRIPGMGYKTVSFALHIYSPTTCQLLTVDCWHVRRMHEAYGKINDRNYCLYEAQLRHDIDTIAELEPGYMPITYAAWLWENTRNPNATEYSSHAGLSCYVAA